MPISETPLVLDPTDDVQGRAVARLRSEQIGWLGTTGRDGFPHAVPIWFLWHDDRALIFSEPATAKVRNIRADQRVALHLEAGEDGESLTVLRGIATLRPEPASAWLDRIGDDYARKYASGLALQGNTLAQMAERYTVVIEVTPHQLIAW